MSDLLNQQIKTFYDSSSSLWENIWGEHMHHGYYGPQGTARVEHYQAQLDLIEELLKWGRISSAKKIYDIGCGIGGSALYLAGKFDAQVTGITLSPKQCQRAQERAAAQALDKQTTFITGDALRYRSDEGQFDLVWSMESGEHLPDKKVFLQTAYDHLAPGGVFLMATWCHRKTPPALSPAESAFLKKLCRAYHLPPMVSIDKYQRIAAGLGFTEIRSSNWTTAVAPFWPAVVKSALSLKGVYGLLQAGWPAIRGALAMRRMIRGYRDGLITFEVFRGKKP